MNIKDFRIYLQNFTYFPKQKAPLITWKQFPFLWMLWRIMQEVDKTRTRRR